jgi:hypothetical protein
VASRCFAGGQQGEAIGSAAFATASGEGPHDDAGDYFNERLIPARIESDSLRRKQCFFEKKHQKTFIRFATRRLYRTRQPMEQKFFGSFFQKRTASLLRLCVGVYAGWYKVPDC